MTEKEILKQIDELISDTDFSLPYYHFTREIDCYKKFYNDLKFIMKNYEKVLEIEHFKQTEI